jgi:hypothetical protein
VRWFDAIPAHDHPDEYRPGSLREGDYAPLLYFAAIDTGLHGEPPKFLPGELVRDTNRRPDWRHRAKVRLEPWQVQRVLGLPERARVTGMYVTQDPLTLFVGFEHPDLPEDPADTEARIVRWESTVTEVRMEERRFLHPDTGRALT